MKKLFLTMCLTTMLASCKPSRQVMYLFNVEYNGIIVRHFPNVKKFEITLKKKNYFIFGSLSTFEHIYLRTSNELSFYDSVEGKIEFQPEERAYTFADKLDERFIDIRYTDEVAESINYCIRCLRLNIFDKNFIFDANA